MRTFSLLLSCALLFCSGGCQTKKKTSFPLTPVVIVSLSPYQTFVEAIAKETLIVKTAVPANFNAHLFEPAPKQMQDFEKGQIFFGIDEPFEKHLLQSLRSYRPSLIYVDLGKGIDRKKTTSPHLHCSHTAHHEEKDRHYWTDPLIALSQSEKILQVLIKHFPEHKELYEKNFEDLKSRFLSLDRELEKTLSCCKNIAIVSSHPSLGYFCERYELEELSIECEGKTPLPQDLQKILSASKNRKVVSVFGYEQFDNKGAVAMSQYLHLPLHIININAPDYFDNMKKIGSTISRSL